MEQKFGRIVNVSSIAALAPRPSQFAYAAAKAAVISFTKSACDPLAPHNIRINSLAPGAINTDMIYEISPEMLEQPALNHAVATFGDTRRDGECYSVPAQ